MWFIKLWVLKKKSVITYYNLANYSIQKRLPSAVSLTTFPSTINSMLVKVTTQWAFHSLELAERERVSVASGSRCGSDMCPGQSFTEISDWNSSNASHVLWELPHVTSKAFQPLDRAAFLCTVHNLLSQLDNLLAASKQWMCIKIYLPHKICSSFVLRCDVFTFSLITLSPAGVFVYMWQKCVILRLLLMLN